MTETPDIREAARLLVEARREGRLLKELPAHAQPASFADAAAVQTEMIRLLGEPVAGYKVAGTDPATVIWGAVLQSRMLESPAAIHSATVPLLGVEAEIAYRLDTDIADDDRAMTLERFDTIVTALTAIEIVDTRFASYAGTPPLHRTADFMSNGALICGPSWPAGTATDFTLLPVRLFCGGTLVVETVGGHAAKDPRLPAVAMINAAGRPTLRRGMVITTGTYTGLQFMQPGDAITADFAGVAEVRMTFET